MPYNCLFLQTQYFIGMILKEESTQIGYIQKSHGVKGELALALIDGVYSEDFDLEFIFLEIDNGLVPFYVESTRTKSSRNILVKLETVDTETRASELCGTEVFIKSTLLNSESELPTNAFIGYKVTDAHKGFIGEITEIQEIANNPLFALNFEGKEILFPINPDFIVAVDDSEKTLNVNLPDGLIDLYLNDSNDDDDDFI